MRGEACNEVRSFRTSFCVGKVAFMGKLAGQAISVLTQPTLDALSRSELFQFPYDEDS